MQRPSVLTVESQLEPEGRKAIAREYSRDLVDHDTKREDQLLVRSDRVVPSPARPNASRWRGRAHHVVELAACQRVRARDGASETVEDRPARQLGKVADDPQAEQAQLLTHLLVDR